MNRPHTVTTRLAALMLGVDVATVRQWARRGKLTRYGSPGRAEYDLAELTRLAVARHAAGAAGGETPAAE
ncbi:MAG TPA: MerR family transcriptional regulator [Actinoplanes sp.]|jgi:hypothetical protein|nr:MerR family transcriptional regulator [Actinoplanes sp.]